MNTPVNFYRTYNLDESVVFHKTREEWGGLSNMAAGYSVKVNEVIFPTIEHLYQACRFPNYPDIQMEIFSEASPMSAKMLSRKYLNYTRPDWNIVRFKIMRWCLEVKLTQNWNSFGGLLLATKGKSIVELAPKDKIWGVVKHGNLLYGINALGRLLMDIRERYVIPNSFHECVNPVFIDDFKIFGNNIGIVCNESDLEEMYLVLHREDTCLSK